jgi:hypothetical protein
MGLFLDRFKVLSRGSFVQRAHERRQLLRKLGGNRTSNLLVAHHPLQKQRLIEDK